MPSGATPRAGRWSAALGGLLAGLLALGVAAAGPVFAVDDPTRPDARVTNGPSCRPGGVVVEVTAGSIAYAVVLATTRRPDGEDSARLAPGETAVLRTGDVAWGETIDSRLEYAALDGSDVTYVDELEGFSFTRPAREDCAAIAPPTADATVPPMSGDRVPGAASSGPAAAASAASVAVGETVTFTASGFAPGELVVLQFHDGTPLGTSVADEDGLVAVDVRIPMGTTAGATTVEIIGAGSASQVSVDLRIAAAAPAADESGAWWPLAVATVAVAGLAIGLLTSGRRGRPRPSSGGG